MIDFRRLLVRWYELHRQEAIQCSTMTLLYLQFAISLQSGTIADALKGKQQVVPLGVRALHPRGPITHRANAHLISDLSPLQAVALNGALPGLTTSPTLGGPAPRAYVTRVQAEHRQFLRQGQRDSRHMPYPSHLFDRQVERVEQPPGCWA